MSKSFNRINSKFFFLIKKFSQLAKKNFEKMKKYCNKQLIIILVFQKKKNHVKISNKFNYINKKFICNKF